METQYKFAITGLMGSGKSTLAGIISLNLHGFKTSFSNQIKKIINQLELPISRDILQETGDFFRQYNNTVWADLLIKELELISGSHIIDGIRYSFERDILVINGFKIIKIISDEDKRRERIGKRDKIEISDETWSQWTAHPTELFSDQIRSDFTIYNNGSFEELKKSVQKILTEKS